MCEQEDCYSAGGVKRTENKQRVFRAKSKYRLVFTDNHERL